MEVHEEEQHHYAQHQLHLEGCLGCLAAGELLEDAPLPGLGEGEVEEGEEEDLGGHEEEEGQVDEVEHDYYL